MLTYKNKGLDDVLARIEGLGQNLDDPHTVIRGDYMFAIRGDYPEDTKLFVGKLKNSDPIDKELLEAPIVPWDLADWFNYECFGPCTSSQTWLAKRLGITYPELDGQKNNGMDLWTNKLIFEYGVEIAEKKYLEHMAWRYPCNFR